MENPLQKYSLNDGISKGLYHTVYAKHPILFLLPLFRAYYTSYNLKYRDYAFFVINNENVKGFYIGQAKALG